jgi:AraC-like DNA-binding protein
VNYYTILPGSELKELVKCYWTLESEAQEQPERQRIVPDGCMEMIFHYGDLFRQYMENGGYIVQPRCFVFGQITRPLEIEPSGAIGIFAVRFEPEGFTPFATIPLKQIENRAVSLQEIFGNEGNMLEQQVMAAENNDERLRLIEAFLLNRLTTPQAIDRISRAAVETITELRGQLSVDELSDQLHTNRRSLERRFISVIGLSPKQLSKMIRLQATIKMLNNGQFTSLTSLAYEGSYYDQAHFIKDFKEFTGTTPKNFYSGSLKMSKLFAQTD